MAKKIWDHIKSLIKHPVGNWLAYAILPTVLVGLWYNYASMKYHNAHSQAIHILQTDVPVIKQQYKTCQNLINKQGIRYYKLLSIQQSLTTTLNKYSIYKDNYWLSQVAVLARKAIKTDSSAAIYPSNINTCFNQLYARISVDASILKITKKFKVYKDFRQSRLNIITINLNNLNALRNKLNAIDDTKLVALIQKEEELNHEETSIEFQNYLELAKLYISTKRKKLNSNYLNHWLKRYKLEKHYFYSMDSMILKKIQKTRRTSIINYMF